MPSTPFSSSDQGRGLAANLKELRGARDLWVHLTLRELRGKYKRSVLGWAWSLLNPTAMMLIYTLVFRYLLKIEVAPGDPSGLDVFPLFLLCGLLPWNYLTNSMFGGMGGLVGNANLVKKVFFPRQILPLASTGAWGISLAIELVQGGKTIKTKRVGTVRAGDQVVTLVVPGSARRGKARLTILLEDRAGNRFEKLVDDPEGQRADQRSEQIADPSEHDHQETVDNIDRTEIGTDIADLAQRHPGDSGDARAEARRRACSAPAPRAAAGDVGSALVRAGSGVEWRWSALRRSATGSGVFTQTIRTRAPRDAHCSINGRRRSRVVCVAFRTKGVPERR